MRTTLLFLLFLPFLGFLILAVAGSRLPRRMVESIACLTILGSLAMAIRGFASGPQSEPLLLFSWIAVGDFAAPMSVAYDPLAAVMALMVTFVSAIIHLYAVGFMREDEGYVRFFCLMNLFVFAMLVITLADNLLFLYLGWEGVGFCSYALIGFWHAEAANATAGRKAFILTRIGDVTFGIAIALFFALAGTLSISAINGKAASLSAGMATFLGFLLLWAAIGKSAQLPLAVWLPDAMAGPTPVSALIHAATMVTAGVYLLMRFFPVIALSPAVLLAIAAVGAFSSLFAACAALAQSDIKRVLAYSTISQVSYMFLGVGAGDVVGGIFLLLSHGFFKALLFLAAGVVIQSLREEHDIFRMGNLRRRLPQIFWLSLAGALALGAIPPFGGFFSKDRILLAAFLHPEPAYKLLGLLAMGTAVLTPLYTFRFFFLAFLDRPQGAQTRDPEGQGRWAAPGLMVWTLWPLAILSLAAGMLNLPRMVLGGEWLARTLSAVPGSGPFPPASYAVETGLGVLTGGISIAVLIAAYAIYRPLKFKTTSAPGALPSGLDRLFLGGFYLDRLYQAVLVRPYQTMAGFLWKKVDERGVDRTFSGAAGLFPVFSSVLQLWANGRISTYLRMMLLGFTLILCAVALGWRAW